ncbi:unnamed protein product, partial [Didymodactylos carnosus]
TMSYEQDEYAKQCTEEICLLFNINDIDISKYINGADDERNEIVRLFDKSFHEH